MFMAGVGAYFPDGCKALERVGGFGREIEELHVLERELPDAYTVDHSVRWTRVRKIRQRWAICCATA